MPRAVRFNNYGGLEVLQVVEVDRPEPEPGKVLVRVKAAGINPGESSIRSDPAKEEAAMEEHYLRAGCSRWWAVASLRCSRTFRQAS